MKPWIALVGSFAALAACSDRNAGAPAVADAASGWLRLPEVDEASVRGDAVVVNGTAEPGGRVVMRGPHGQAYATVADTDGRFAFRLKSPPNPVIYRVDAQDGQEVRESSDRLLLIPGHQGVSAVLVSGGPTRRLGQETGGLAVVDSDGSSLLTSGSTESSPGPTDLRVDGRALPPAEEPEGRWVARAEAVGPALISVDGVDHRWPGHASATSDLVERAGKGWRATWRTSDGATQSAWFPDNDG